MTAGWRWAPFLGTWMPVQSQISAPLVATTEQNTAMAAANKKIHRDPSTYSAARLYRARSDSLATPRQSGFDYDATTLFRVGGSGWLCCYLAVGSSAHWRPVTLHHERQEQGRNRCKGTTLHAEQPVALEIPCALRAQTCQKPLPLHALLRDHKEILRDRN